MNKKVASLRLKLILVLCLVPCIFALGDAEAASKSKTKKAAAYQDSAEQSVLPKTGDIAILVEGPEEHVPRVEANIVNILTNRGYRVVDEAKMKKIRLAAARALADKYILYGEKSKILKINASYNVAATIIATITPEQTRENRINLFTGTASVSIMAVKSNGVKLGGKTCSSQQIGYTESETLRKAVDDAVDKSMLQLF